MARLIKDIRKGQYGWDEGFDKVLSDEGLDLRDFELLNMKDQKRIEAKLKKVIEGF